MTTSTEDLISWWRIYLPEELRGMAPYRPEGTDLAIWRDVPAEGAQPRAWGFQGNARKPVWVFRFRDEAQREAFISEKIAGRKAHFARKAERAADRKNAAHNLVVGDILSSSWGYDQTNVDFYQVVEVKTPKTIVIRQIGKAPAPADQQVLPAPGDFIGEPMLKRVNAYGSVKIEDFAHASKWSGRPMYETDIRAGH